MEKPSCSTGAFHGGAAGTRGIENAAIHFNIGMDGNGETFQYWFLHKFDRVEAKPYFKPGIVKPDGTIDKNVWQSMVALNWKCCKVLMIGWYPECAEWDGVELKGRTPLHVCNLETYMKSQHVEESSGGTQEAQEAHASNWC